MTLWLKAEVFPIGRFFQLQKTGIFPVCPEKLPSCLKKVLFVFLSWLIGLWEMSTTISLLLASPDPWALLTLCSLTNIHRFVPLGCLEHKPHHHLPPFHKEPVSSHESSGPSCLIISLNHLLLHPESAEDFQEWFPGSAAWALALAVPSVQQNEATQVLGRQSHLRKGLGSSFTQCTC